MLRQNRYKIDDFIVSPNDLKLINDEIILSEKHDIVIALEPHQIEKYEDLKNFIIEISKNIPKFDNEVQDYYELVEGLTDFPLSLAIIYFEENKVILDYWHDDVNSQFNVIFQYEHSKWNLKIPYK